MAEGIIYGLFGLVALGAFGFAVIGLGYNTFGLGILLVGVLFALAAIAGQAT